MLTLISLSAYAATLQVGPAKPYHTPCEAASVVQDGDTVEIDAGTYTGDVCAWTKSGLTLRGVGGYAHLEAAGQAAQGKGTWVIQGADTTVEWIEFSGASVPDQNGAGIRQEGANLTVDHCWFHDNEDGILAGDNADSDITITNSEFAHNGFGDGQSHNLYINHVRSLTFAYNYTHHAYKGHTLKSRAYVSRVLYNRIADEADGQASYQINLPNGGLAIVVGNVIQQGPAAENGGIVSFAEEGATNPEQALYLVNNTFVNDRGSGTFVTNASAADATLVNNLFVGGGTVLNGPGTQLASLETADPMFVDAAAGDYDLLAGSPAIDAGVDPGTASDGTSLTPTDEYTVTGGGTPRPTVGPLDIGAFEFGEADVPGDSGGATDTDTDPGTGPGTGTDADPDDVDTATDVDDPAADGDGKGGCGCDTGSASGAGVVPWLAVAALLRIRRRS